MDYLYPDFICTDGKRPAPYATGSFYASDDKAYTTPLQIRNLAGELLGTAATADEYGYVRQRRLPVMEAVWKSGPLPEQPMQSFEGLRLEMETARASAEGSASDAAASAAAATAAANLVDAPAGEAVRVAVAPGGAAYAELSATIAEQIEAAGGSADTLTIQRIDREAMQAARSSSGSAAIAYADATELTKGWTDLTGWQTTSIQVSGNRLYAAGAGIALKSFPVAANETAHFSTVIRYVAGSGTQATYFGIDTDAPDHAPSTAAGAFIGINSSGARGTFIGASFGASALDTNTIGGALSSGDYLATIEVSPSWITFSLARVDSPSADSYTFKVSRATLATAGKTINNVTLYCDDTRTTAGHSLGPVVAVKSLQPARTRTVAGFVTEAATHRTLTVRSAAADNWRIGIPSGYDARKPAPVVLFHHQSLTGNQNTPWSEGRAQPVTDALLDAGYIVAAANDGGDRWGNQASLDNYRALYEYVRAHWATGSLYMLGVSMGFMPVLNAVVRRSLPTPAAMASIGGVSDLDTLYMNNTGTYASGIRAAYGVASDGSDYEAKTAGFNPMDREGSEFRGVPVRFYTSTGDTAVPKTTNPDPMSAKLSGFAPETEVVLGSGGHLDVSQYQPSDLLAFFGRYQ